jgi:hypothetical protein
MCFHTSVGALKYCVTVVSCVHIYRYGTSSSRYARAATYIDLTHVCCTLLFMCKPGAEKRVRECFLLAVL